MELLGCERKIFFFSSARLNDDVKFIVHKNYSFIKLKVAATIRGASGILQFPITHVIMPSDDVVASAFALW